MLFTSPIFLCLFLPVLFAVYVLVAPTFRIHVLLAASLFFYSWGEPKAVFIMTTLIIITWIAGNLIAETTKQKNKNIFITLGICTNLLALFTYKYLNFFIENINFLGFNINDPKLPLPIGISFYTFQAISYLVDVYRRTIKPSKSFINFATYISLFPQLVMGPIIRFKFIQNSFKDRKINLNNIFYGLQRFIMGFGKKILIADTMAIIADTIFSSPAESIPFLISWLGALAFLLQLYYDFSGYSDMAIGLGRMFNFRFPENFKYPYSAISIQDFWFRWHISLTSFFRNYLHRPLAIKLKRLKFHPIFTKYFLLFLTTICIGLWHGAAWNFVFLGVFIALAHGLSMLFLRSRNGMINLKNFKIVLNIFFVFTLLPIGMVVFRSSSLRYAFNYLKIMITGNSNYSLASFSRALDFISITNGITLVIAIVLCYPVMAKIRIKYRNHPLWLCLLFIIFFLSFAISSTKTLIPFLYFKF
ncbi:MAG: MBOAT family protein [Elusimicrobiota bacterium]|jgi:alginate O-acetyltransferase complex protein AlgI|nr:MBOAT family protein [Elusimicrobiota bacterium]